VKRKYVIFYVSEKTKENFNANCFFGKLLQEIHLFKTNKSAKLLKETKTTIDVHIHTVIYIWGTKNNGR